MKLEVIGWTYYENRAYPDHRGEHGAVDRAVIEAIRAGGYRFGGNTHEDAITGVPVLSDGTKACYSRRGWGMVMARALGIDGGDYAYMHWYMDTAGRTEDADGGLVLPPRGVDKGRIKGREALSETFEMHLCPAAFDAVVSGKKTVELRLYDEKRSPVCRGDVIDFQCGDRRCRVRVTRAETFDDFNKFFSGKQFGYENGRAYAHRQSLVRRAFFGDCKTAQALCGYLFSVYPEEVRSRYYALAISIKRI